MHLAMKIYRRSCPHSPGHDEARVSVVLVRAGSDVTVIYEVNCALSRTRRQRVRNTASTSSVVPNTHRTYIGRGQRGFYRSAPGSIKAALDFTSGTKLRDARRQLRPAHEATLDVALQWPIFHQGARVGHSNDAVRLLETFLGETPPRPSHADDSVRLARWEGAIRRTTLIRYERNRRARQDWLLQHGAACAARGLLFGQRYGPAAAGLIHVHHVKQVARGGGKRRPVNGERDRGRPRRRGLAMDKRIAAWKWRRARACATLRREACPATPRARTNSP